MASKRQTYRFTQMSNKIKQKKNTHWLKGTICTRTMCIVLFVSWLRFLCVVRRSWNEYAFNHEYTHTDGHMHTDDMQYFGSICGSCQCMRVRSYVCKSRFDGIVAHPLLATWVSCIEVYRNNNNTILWFLRNVTIFSNSHKNIWYMLAIHQRERN